jgi:hypothetical protein
MTTRGERREEIRRLCAAPEVVRPEHEDLREYANVLKAYRAERKASRPPDRPSVKRCGNPGCPCEGRIFQRQDGESITKYINRRYCSQSCQVSHANLKRYGDRWAAITAERRTCRLEGCDHPIERREDETWQKFAERQYCSNTCRKAGQMLTRRETDRIRLLEKA